MTVEHDVSDPELAFALDGAEFGPAAGGFGGVNALAGAAPDPAPVPSGTSTKLASVDSIRNVFPETWLWTNSSVGY